MQYVKNKRLVAVAFAGVFATVIVIVRQIDALSYFALLRFLTGLWFMCYMSLTDMKEHLVRNKVILCMVGLWAFYTFVELWALGVNAAVYEAVMSIFAGIFGFAIFFAAYLFTKKQLGAGDVKLAFAMGLYLSTTRIAAALIYGLLACSLFSLIMILLKKLQRKSEIPLVPFLALGYFITLLFKV